MAKQLNYSVSFTPDTSALQKTMQDLQTQLQSIASTKITVDDGSMKQAVQSAKDLQKYLLLATDATTGNLDLSKFSAVLKNAGTDVTQLSTKLMGIGPQGNQAFMTLARGVAQAQIPMKKTNKLLDEMWTTMKNTARWQLTSSAMHGFMGAMQSALNYSEKLNKSLTDIRIVSEKSATAMDKFAVKANQAAKNLSTTTTAYTDAALIYYQQGLDDTQVEERTDITVKMANVVGESATEVSSYMTAIWNNFATGSESLEYYGDVMAKLGAETAASSAEIAEGLEKFASIGETVGLSYEYAASAVATVVDKTRQSADTVGTAFKTIFARIQGLNLGETLDDGTTLNKYSEALEKVGINIKDQFGNLKNTDVILDEMGAKWKMLSEDQQMALAQTVAGTRQYTQLMSLMNNYDDFKINVDLATNSEGTLEEQAEIYAQSWEAASNRAQASLEDMYDSIINDDAIIGLIDTFSSITDSLSEAIDGFGGFGNILIMVGSIFVNKFSGKIVAELSRLKDNFNVFTGKAKKDMMSLQTQMSQELGFKKENATAAEGAEMDSVANLIAAKQKLAMISEDLTDSERQYAEYQVSVVNKLAEKVALLAEEAQKKEQASQNKESSFREGAVQAAGEMAKESGENQYDARKTQGANFDKYTKSLKKAVQEEVKATKARKDFNKAMEASEKALKKGEQSGKKNEKTLKSLQASLKKTAEGFSDAAKETEEFKAAMDILNSAAMTDEEYDGAVENLRIALEATEQEAIDAARALQSIDAPEAVDSGLGQGQIQELADTYREEAEAVNEVNDALGEQEEASKNLDMSHAVTGTERVLSMASAMGNLYSVYNAVASIGSIWSDEDATTGEKIMSTIMTMSTLLPAVVGTFEALDKVMAKNNATKAKSAIADAAVTAGTAGVTAGKTAETGAVVANTAAWFSNPITAIIAGALLLVVAAIGAVTAGMKAQSESIQQNADKWHEDAQALKATEEANRKNLQSMNDLLAKYKETGEGKEELDQITQTLAESYDIEGAALARLTGQYADYKKVADAAYDKHKEELENRYETEKKAMLNTGKAMLDSADNAGLDGGGSNVKGGKLNLTLDGYGNETAEQDILERFIGKDGSASDKNDYDISISDDPEKVLELYDKLTEAKTAMIAELDNDTLEDSGTYEDLTQWLEAMEEDVEAYREHLQAVQDIELELGKVEGAENIMDELQNVSTLEEYQTWVTNVTKALQDLGYSEDEIAEKIDTLTNNSFNPQIASLKEMDKAFQDLETVKGIDKQAAQDYFNGLSEEDQQLFWSINFDTAKTEEAWTAQMNNLKAKAEVEAIQVKIEAVETAQGALKENMSEEDYAAIKDSGIDWGNAEEGIINFSDFVRMSYTEQQKYLENLNDEYAQQSVDAAEKAKEAALNQIDTCETAIEELEAELAKETDVTKKAEIQAEITGYEQQKKDLLDDIDEIDADLEIELKIKRDEEFNDLLDDLEDMKGVNDSLVKDIKKVGSNYELTAEQARSWVSVYPELMKNATVTSEGIVQLNADQVNEFIKGKEAELMAEGEAEIAKLEITRAGLVAKKEKAVAELELANAVARGEVDIETALTQTIAGAEQQLTDYLMQLGMEETDAQAAAAAAKAGNMEEYQRITADVADNNAYNLAYSMAAAADATSMNAQQMVNSIDAIGQQAANVAEQIGAMAEGNVTYDGAVSVSGGGVTKNDFIAQVDGGNFKAGEYTKATTSDIEITQWQDRLLSDIGGYDSAIAEIDTRIAEIRAGMASSLNTYTPGTQRNSDAYDDDGSGSDSDKEKDVEELEEVAERYHEINREIEYYNSLLDENSKKKDRAFGKEKLKYMKEEQRLLNEKYKREKDLFDLQTAFLASDQKAIEDSFSGAKFDSESGELTNYTDMLQQATDNLNDAKKKYNDSDQDDDDKKALEKAEEEYDKQIALLEQYEETLDEWRQQKSDLQDLANEIYDAKLEELEYKVDLQIEFSDDELKALEYQLGRIEEKAFSAAEALANLGEQTKVLTIKHETYKSGMQEIFANHGLSQEEFDKWLQGDEDVQKKLESMNLTESEVETLKEYRDGLMDTSQAMIDLRASVHEKILSSFEEVNEELDKGISKIEHLQNVTEHFRNIVDIVGKANIPNSDKLIKSINETAVSQSKNKYEATAAKRDTAKANLDAAKEAYKNQAGKLSEEERKMWEDSIQAMEEELAQFEEDAQADLEAWMQSVNKQFEDSVQSTIDAFTKAVAGEAGTLAQLQDSFSRKATERERYLEDYQKIYEFSKLNRDIESSIDNTDNLRAKQELRDLQAEINELEESGAEVSEYQMENLRKRYELKMAELALEEAKNAKSEVRMTRDSEGNWGYTYTADESAVAAAEQSYEDKLYAIQEQNTEYINALQENIVTMQQEMADKLQEIAMDESLSIEEREAKMAEVQAFYQEQMGYYCDELELALGNNKKLYDEDWTDYAQKTGYKISKDEEYVDSFQETDLAVLTGFNNMEDYQANFNTASESLLDESSDAFDTWQVNMDAAFGAAGFTMENFADQADRELDKVKDDSQAVADKVKEDAGFMQGDYQEVIDKIVEWENQYSQSIASMVGESDKIIEKFNSVLALWAQVKSAASQPTPTPDSGGGDGDGGGSGGGSGGGGSGGGGSGDGGGKPSWDRVVAAYDKINQGKWGNGIQNRISKGKADGFTEAEVRAGQQLINYTYPTRLNGYGYSREKAKGLMGYDTGGYTGAWGDQSGRLALLHQKELVLNQEDTANMLAAIDMVRQISSMIDLNAMSSMKGVSALLSAGGVGAGGGNFEQHVEIHASFPDATDHSEIEEAFNNLLNSASQYANRKL